MHIGVFSCHEDELEKAVANLTAFGAQAHLQLQIWPFHSQKSILECLSKVPLDILVFDTTQIEDYQARVWEVVHTIATCQLILSGDDLKVAVFGYTVGAKNYLSTPLGEEDLIQAVALLIKKKLENSDHVIPVYTAGAWSQLPSHQITRIESAGHYLQFHMSDGVMVKTNATFREYEWNLSINPDFLRCHQSYVVNLNYVSALEKGQFIMKDGVWVNISRPYLMAARSVFSSYKLRTYRPAPNWGGQKGGE